MRNQCAQTSRPSHLNEVRGRVLSHAHSSLPPQSPSHFGAVLRHIDPPLTAGRHTQRYQASCGQEACKAHFPRHFPRPHPPSATSAPGRQPNLQDGAPSPPLIYHTLTVVSRITLLVLTSFSCPWHPLLQERPKSASRYFKTSSSVHQVIDSSRECLKSNVSSPECDPKFECVKPTRQATRQARNQGSCASSPPPIARV